MMRMLTRLKLHRPYNSKILMASTGPNRRPMSLLVSRLQLLLEQLLTDIWVSSPQGSTFEHVEDYISTLWLQGTFYNFYPFEIQFFSTNSKIYLLPQMLVNIFFLSSFSPLTKKSFKTLTSTIYSRPLV